MGILRYGDPDNNPNDRMIYNNGLYELDIVFTSGTQAGARAKQLEDLGNVAYIHPRMASPGEAHQHLTTPAYIGKSGVEYPEYVDGRFTKVWEVWILRKYVHPKSRRRKKKSSKKRVKRCKCE